MLVECQNAKALGEIGTQIGVSAQSMRQRLSRTSVSRVGHGVNARKRNRKDQKLKSAG